MKKKNQHGISNEAIEAMLAKSPAFEPRSDLRSEILTKAAAARAEAHKAETAPLQAAPVKPKMRRSRRAVLAAVLVLILTAVPMTTTVFAAEYEVVYVDINPSVALSLNRAGQIIKVECLNEDASSALANIKIKGKNVDDGIDLLMDTLNEQGYLANSDISISVYSKNEEKADRLRDAVEDRVSDFTERENCEAKIYADKITKEVREHAKESGISPTKFNLIQDILDFDDTYTERALKDMTTRELRELAGKRPQGGENQKPHFPDKERDEGLEEDEDEDRYGNFGNQGSSDKDSDKNRPNDD